MYTHLTLLRLLKVGKGRKRRLQQREEEQQSGAQVLEQDQVVRDAPPQLKDGSGESGDEQVARHQPITAAHRHRHRHQAQPALRGGTQEVLL